MRYCRALCSLLLLALVCQGSSWAQKSKISHLIYRHRLEKKQSMIKRAAPSFNDNRLRLMGYDLANIEAESCALYVETPLLEEEIAQLADKGIEVSSTYIPPVNGKHPYGFYLAAVSYDSLETIERDSRFKRLDSVERKAHLCNDISAQLTFVEDVRLSGANGAGVNIAIIDTGLDLSHPDIPTPIEAFDVTVGENSANWSTSVPNRFTHHGTHVTGTCLGRGSSSNGKYRGAASGANLYFYKVEDSSGHIYTDYLIKAINRAREVGCHILSMSIGSPFGPRDGSSPECQAIDAATEAGVTCFLAAGNERQLSEHLAISVAPGESTTFAFHLENPYTAIDAWHEYIDFYWSDNTENEKNINIKCQSLATSESVTSAVGVTARGTEFEELILRYQMAPLSTKDYLFEITNAAQEGDDVDVHVFHYLPLNNYQGTLVGADDQYSVNSPAVADTAIAVGAWVHRRTHQDYTGILWEDVTVEENTLAAFSSIGPRLDGVLKPDVVAPGFKMISCRDSGVPAADLQLIDDDGLFLNGVGPAHYLVMSGTSMATPWAAGVGALLKQLNPQFSAEQIADKIRMTAGNAAHPNNEIGYGLVNGKAAIGAGILAAAAGGNSSSGGCTINVEQNDKGWLLPLWFLLVFSVTTRIRRRYCLASR